MVAMMYAQGTQTDAVKLVEKQTASESERAVQGTWPSEAVCLR